MALPQSLNRLITPSGVLQGACALVVGGVTALSAAAVSSAEADAVPAAEIAEVAMQSCIRSGSDASAGVQAEGFSVRSRTGSTYIYEHEAGPIMILISQPGFFNCDMEIPNVESGYLDTLLSELGPRIERRFGATDPHRGDDGVLWRIETEAAIVSIDIAEREEGVVSITFSADAAPLTQPMN